MSVDSRERQPVCAFRNHTIRSERGSGLRRMVDVEEIGLLRTVAGAINRFKGFELRRPEEPVQATPGSG
jgi:hypothetical protein